jgi:uncharacterized repeat protein (TIGR01451 family)
MMRPRAVGLPRGWWTLILVLLVLVGCRGASENDGDASAGFSRLVLHTTSTALASGSLRRAASMAETRQAGEPVRLLVSVEAADISPTITVDCPLPGPPPDDGFTGDITATCTITGTPEATITILENTTANIRVEIAIMIPDGLDRQVTVTVLDASADVVSQGQVTVDVPTTDPNVEIILTSETDLSLAKTDTPDPVLPGQQLTYTLTVTNNGPIDATGVTVTDTLPAGVTFRTADSSSACSAADGTVTCLLGALANQTQMQVTISVIVDATTTEPLANTADVAGNQPDPNPGNNGTTISTTVLVAADLAVAKVATPDSVTAGTALTYTITITNNGPSEATGVTVTDPLPAGVTFQAAGSSSSCSATDGTVTCPLGALANQAQAVVTIVVTVNPDTTSPLVNTATVDSDQSEPVSSEPITTTVKEEADLAISKSGNPDLALPGLPLLYALTVTNHGPSKATGVTVADPLPVGFFFTQASTTRGTCSNTEGTVSCDLGTLPAGASATVSIEGVVTQEAIPNAFVLLLSDDVDTPTVTLVNAALSDSITEFIMTIGDTSFNFASVFDEMFEEQGPSNARFTLITPGKHGADKVHYTFSGFEFGDVFSFKADINPDNDGDTATDYRQVLFDLDGSDDSDNALVTVHFASGTTISRRLPDFPSEEINGFFFVGTSEGSVLIVNTATVRAETDDPDPEDNSATDETTVTISGIAGEVTASASGLPLEGITVQAVDPISGMLVAETATDDEGFYVMLVSPGVYKVVALGDDLFVTEWFDNASSFETASPVTVRPIAVVDFVLESAGN